MRLRFGLDVLSESGFPLVTAATTIAPISTAAYLWQVEFANYKSYYIGHEDCPITDGNFSLTTYGSGNSDISLARTMLPLKSQDIVNIYFRGDKMWSGFLTKEPDKRQGKLDLSPQIEKFNNAVFNSTFSGTWTTAIQAILTDSADVTSITYSSTKIALSATDTVAISYNYTNVKSIFDEMIKNFDGKYYGVDSINNMFISSYSTTINYTIYADDLPAFSDVKVTIDDTKIKMTRAQVFQRSTSLNKNIRLGQVGYADPYPTFNEVEQRTGIKEVALTIPQSLVSTPSSQNAALTYAYQQIKADAVVNTNVVISALDYDRYPLTVGQLIRVYQPYALAWQTVLDCDSVTGWNSATLSTGTPKRGTGSLQVSTGISSYEWQKEKFWSGVKKVGFFVYSVGTGEILSFNLKSDLPTGSTYSMGSYSMSTSLTSSGNTVSYFTANVWKWVEFPTTWQNFSAVTFQQLTTAVVYIDDFSVYGYNRNYYDVNVKEIKFNFNSNLVDVTAGYYDEGINDEFFKLKRQVERIEETQQA